MKKENLNYLLKAVLLEVINHLEHLYIQHIKKHFKV